MIQTIYDIIKAHGGKIKIAIREAEGKFLISVTGSDISDFKQLLHQ